MGSPYPLQKRRSSIGPCTRPATHDSSRSTAASATTPPACLHRPSATSPVVIVADDRTNEAAGRDVRECFRRAGVAVPGQQCGRVHEQRADALIHIHPWKTPPRSAITATGGAGSWLRRTRDRSGPSWGPRRRPAGRRGPSEGPPPGSRGGAGRRPRRSRPRAERLRPRRRQSTSMIHPSC